MNNIKDVEHMDNELNKDFHNDIASLANDITYHSYNISKLSVQKLFDKMTAADYVALCMVLKTSDNADEPQEGRKIYLADIAETLKLSMEKVSRLVRTLQERGLVVWKHDGKGEDGTYIMITDKGLHSAEEQQEKLKRFYADVIEQFGKDRFVALLAQLKELEDIMSEEMEEGAN